MSKNEKVLLGSACFLGGVVVGFLLAPIKKGVYCGNNNGNTVGSVEELDSIMDKNIVQEEVEKEVDNKEN